jgi:hypothetical protein
MTFVATDSPDRQSRLSRCIVMVEIPYMPDSTLHCTFSCRCHVSVCTVSLGFTFSKQMHNSANTEKPMSVLVTFKQTCLTFCGHGDGGLVHWDKSCLVSWWYPLTHVSSPVINFERNSGSVSGLFCRPGHVLTWISRSSLGLGMIFASNSQRLRFFFKRSDLTQMKFSACEQY